MLVEFGSKSLLGKARSQPERVRQVIDKVRTDGLGPTLEAVFARLDQPLPLGYSNVGRVLAIGPGVQGFSVGDRVASNGPHAEVVCVPANLAARIPEAVSDEDATFTVLGSIALHGVRLLEPTLGERFAVIGLGLLGQLAVQLLRASGCRVLGIDISADRCRLAERFGAIVCCPAEGGDPVAAAGALTGGTGVDGVLITASAKTDQIIHDAATMCRKRGRIVLTGVVGLNLRRSDFYEKELSFRVSCAYGPGRYDPDYEQKGHDYPVAYVRWTAGRNFQAVLDAIAAGQLEVQPLISRRIALDDVSRAYDALLHDAEVLGVVLEYPQQVSMAASVRVHTAPPAAARSDPAEPVIGLIGAGNFTQVVLLPALKAAQARIHTIASAGGVSALHAARRFGAQRATSDYREILQDEQINTVFITTRHDRHAAMVVEALEAGKHVFVEKPLAIDTASLERVREAHARHPERQLMVGFNRRFAPHAVWAAKLLAGRSEPVCIHALVNAGAIPPDHWVHDPAVGGGRIIGEGCHFIDLALYWVGAPIRSVQAVSFGPQAPQPRDDKASIVLSFEDGSIATVHYWANGPRRFPKERFEIFSQNRALVLENWRKATPFGFPGARLQRGRQDKGHKAEVAAFLERIRTGGGPLIPFEQLEQVTRASIAAVEAARSGQRIDLREVPVAPAVPQPAATGSRP